jgi:glycosyltransferase involved in cell wall biosynthesis
MLISVIIPCYNEEKTIVEIVEKVVKKKQDFNLEIIIVDDHSVDETVQIINQKLKDKIDKLFVNDQNYGKGYSIRQGIKNANGEILILQDADLEYSPDDYKKLLDPILNNKADVVYGSRFVGSEAKRVLYFWHYIGNKILTTFSNMLSNLNLTDMETGYKVFKSDIIKKINLVENRFGFEPEITAKVAKLKPRIYEVGISYFGRTYSEGKKITWKDGFSALKCIIKYNF